MKSTFTERNWLKMCPWAKDFLPGSGAKAKDVEEWNRQVRCADPDLFVAIATAGKHNLHKYVPTKDADVEYLCVFRQNVREGWADYVLTLTEAEGVFATPKNGVLGRHDFLVLATMTNEFGATPEDAEAAWKKITDSYEKAYGKPFAKEKRDIQLAVLAKGRQLGLNPTSLLVDGLRNGTLSEDQIEEIAARAAVKISTINTGAPSGKPPKPPAPAQGASTTPAQQPKADATT